MTVITIREQSQTATGFEVNLVIDGSNYLVALSDPFNSVQEEELEWYFEEWLRYPILNPIKAERVKASIKQYGEALFEQLFQADNRAYAKYRQLINNCDGKLQIEIESTNPKFHAIHWEALKDPALPRPFSVDSILVRNSLNPVVLEAKAKPSPTINILVVVARPNAEHDIGYRTISRPLVEAIRQAKTRVNLEILRPGTYEALSKHLEVKGKGYYHIVHFDVHGTLKTYAEIKEGIEQNRYVSDGRYGREQIAEYEGKKAFLALEGENKGEYDLVEASELADLLTGKGIPVCILNACQSGKQTPETRRDTSLGSRLMLAGMQMVVAMSYSITVTAAEIMMKQIYTCLFANQDLNSAIRLSRKELHEVKKRKAYYNTEINLEDWLLPIVYCRGEIALNLREFTPEEEEQYYLGLDSHYKFNKPNYGFVGRDIDILLIEKALLKHNILLLKGMGGAGKTTLLNYLQEWWRVTKFAEKIFYFSYDTAAHTLEKIVNEINKQIYNDSELINFQSKSFTVQWRKLADKLRAESHILILDNLESVTGQALAIPNTLDETAREEIKKFLFSLANGKTKVILGSRISEEWLQPNTFRDNIYQLKGLDVQARSDLAEKIIKRVNSSQSLDRLEADEDFERLMNLLAGYPLAMEVVLANLKNQTPQKILENLAKANIDPGGKDKTNNILKCIEYSHSNLSKSVQETLLFFAPFKGFIFTLYLNFYKDTLSKTNLFKNCDFSIFGEVIKEAKAWGLLTCVDPNYPSELVAVQPLLPYFLQTKLKKADRIFTESLLKAYVNYYFQASASYTHLMQSKQAYEKFMGISLVKWEYENIYHALQLGLQYKIRTFNMWDCLFNYLKIENKQKQRFKLTKDYYEQLSHYEEEHQYPEIARDIVAILGGLGDCYKNQRQFKKAQQLYLEILSLIPTIDNLDDKNKQWDIATTYHQLGLISNHLKEYQVAKKYYIKSLEIYDDIEEESEKAGTYSELGTINQQLKEYSEAQSNYHKALKIFEKPKNPKDKDDVGLSYIHHNLGGLAYTLGNLSQAQYHYEQALPIKIRFGDHKAITNTLNSLGDIAQQLGNFERAREYHQNALDVCIKNRDRFSLANTYRSFGLLETNMSEFGQAKDYLFKALYLFAEFQHELGWAASIKNLGGLYQKSKDNSIAIELAPILNITVIQAKELLKRNNNDKN